MKNFTLIITALALLLASCKKDHQAAVAPDNSDAKKYPVSFTVSQFEQTTGSINMQRSLALLAQKKNLSAAAVDTSVFAQSIFEYFYLVYDSSGKEIKRIIRNALYPGFVDVYQLEGKNPVRDIFTRTDNDPYNVITDTLAAGTYTVVVAGNSYLKDDELEIDYNDDNFSRIEPVFSPLSTATVFTGQGLDVIPRSMDIFFGKCVVTVSGPTKADAITLNRIVGEVEVDLKDAVIPKNVQYIILGRAGELNGYSIAHQIPNTPTDLSPDPPQTLDNDFLFLTKADRTKGLYVMQRFVLNTISPIDIVLSAYDANGNIVATKTIPRVQIQKNRRTILSGKLFDNSVPAQFTLSANQAWGPDTPPINF